MVSIAREVVGIILAIVGALFFLVVLAIAVIGLPLVAAFGFIIFVLPFWLPAYFLLRPKPSPPTLAVPPGYVYQPYAPPPVTQVVVERTTMKCSYCGTIYDMALGHCPSCGGSP